MVNEKYYDDGSVEIEKPVPSIAEKSFNRNNYNHDFYCNVFKSFSEALKYYKDAVSHN